MRGPTGEELEGNVLFLNSSLSYDTEKFQAQQQVAAKAGT